MALIVVATGLPAAEPEGEEGWSERASQRAALLFEDEERLHISLYPGFPLRDKGLHSLSLVSAADAPFIGGDFGGEDFRLGADEMRKFVRALADSGILDGATHYDPSLKIVRELFRPEGYAIHIRNFGPQSWVMEMDLGWDPSTVETLEALREGLGGEAGEAMDRLLMRVEEFRGEWGAAVEEGTGGGASPGLTGHSGGEGAGGAEIAAPGRGGDEISPSGVGQGCVPRGAVAEC